MFKKRKNSPANQATFIPQAYPLYAWGVWASQDIDTESMNFLNKLVFHEDRLLVVGWQQCGSRLEPVVLDYDYGPVALVELTGDWPAQDFDGYEYLLDEDGERQIFKFEKFYLAEISISEPHKDVIESTKSYAELIFSINNYPTVVDEELSLEV